MRVLVTGGGGFLGRYVVEALAARGDTPVALGRSRYPALEEQGVECLQVDLADRDAVIAACEGMDGVIHCGARAGFWGPREDYYRTNVEGTRNVIEGCRRHGVSRLVHTSSPSVVIEGEDLRGVDESHPYPAEHSSAYGETKAIAEREVLRASDEDSLMTCALRPHLVFGPRDNHILPRIVDRARRGMLKIVGDGSNRVDVTYVTNAADAHLLALDRLVAGSPVAGRPYFLSQGEPVLLWDFINRILTGFGVHPVTSRVSLKNAVRIGWVLEKVHRTLGLAGEPRMTPWLARELGTSHWFDISAARQDLGYEPAVNTDEGLERTLAAGLPGA